MAIFYFSKRFIALSFYPYMMTYRVKQDEGQGLNVLICIVDSLFHSEEVHKIRLDLLKMLEKPANHTDLSKDRIDDIFKGPSGDWADEKDGRGYGAIKPVFALIKKLMFEDESKGKRIAGGDEH